jgi:hypothetical protein
MKRIRIELALLEDLHTGSGTGIGDIDALLARDRDGLPVLRASHVRGVWADALDRPADRTALFGASRAAAGQMSMTSFYAMSGNPGELCWSSTRFQSDSRVPEEDTLRTRQFIAAGSRFAATAWLPEGLEPALLSAATRADALGARRRRGDGLFQITSWQVEADGEAKIQRQPEGDAPVLRLLLRAEDPLCFAQTGFPGNILPGECYIRGQQLLGAFVKPLLDAGQTGLAALWLDRQTSVGNAYPLPDPAPRDGAASADWETSQVLPIPLCYQGRKAGGSGAGFPWWAVGAKAGPVDVGIIDKLVSQQKAKRPGDRDFLFRAHAEAGWQLFSAPLALRMRNAVPRDQNQDGSLFTQEEILERTCFIADICFPDVPRAEQLAETLRAYIGGGRCLNLGRGGGPVVIEAAAWLPTATLPQDAPEADSLELLLTTDLIARDEYLAFWENLDAAALAGLCGLPPAAVAQVQTKGVADTVEIHGFNALTGLPRMPALAMRRGSCWRFSGDVSAIAALRKALQQRQESGLGERRWEGYGRFLLDFRQHLPAQSIQRHAKAAEKPKANPLELAIQAAEQAWNEYKNTKGIPRLAHWQRLRGFAQQGPDELLAELDNMLGNPRTQDGIKAFATWLRTTLERQQDQGIAIDEFYRQLLRWVRLELRDPDQEAHNPEEGP